MAKYQGFCGPSVPSQSAVADCERLVNWYCESVQSSAAPTDVALYPVPGLTPVYATVDVGDRGALTHNGHAYRVIGSGFYEIFSDGSSTRIGTVAQDSNPATLCANGQAGDQIFITSGSNGYIYDISDGTLTTVLTGTATMGAMLDARFLAFDAATGKVALSALNDGLTWDASLYFERELGSDPWKAMIVRAPEIWLIGDQTGEVWYDSGAFPQPMAPIPGAFFQVGIGAPFSVAVVGEYVTWVSQTSRGSGTVVAAKGYVPASISSFAVENAISGYLRTSRIDDAEVLVYDEGGHAFACWSFPTAGGTWVYDFNLPHWHERGAWNGLTGRYETWRPRAHSYAFGKHLVGERATGTISVMDSLVGAEADGSAIRRQRIAPPLWAQAPGRLFIDRFQIMLEPGLGTVSGQGADPQLALRVSYDAKTWGSERLASAGRMGDYQRRVVFSRCGSSDWLWVPEIVVTDPIPWRILGADLMGSGFQQGASA